MPLCKEDRSPVSWGLHRSRLRPWRQQGHLRYWLLCTSPFLAATGLSRVAVYSCCGSQGMATCPAAACHAPNVVRLKTASLFQTLGSRTCISCNSLSKAQASQPRRRALERSLHAATVRSEMSVEPASIAQGKSCSYQMTQRPHQRPDSRLTDFRLLRCSKHRKR